MARWSRRTIGLPVLEVPGRGHGRPPQVLLERQADRQGDAAGYRSDGENKSILYLEVLFEDVIVSNVSLVAEASDPPTENISPAYGKVTYKYKSQVPDTGAAGGVQPVSHDLIKQEVS